VFLRCICSHLKLGNVKKKKCVNNKRIYFHQKGRVRLLPQRDPAAGTCWASLHRDMTLPSSPLPCHSLGKRLPSLSRTSKMASEAARSRRVRPRAAWSLLLMLGYFSWNTVGDAVPLLRRVRFLVGFERGECPGERREHRCPGELLLGREALPEPLWGNGVSFDPALLAPCLSHSGVLSWIKYWSSTLPNVHLLSFSVKMGLTVTDFLLKIKLRKTACKSYDFWKQADFAKHWSADNTEVTKHLVLCFR